MVNKTLIIFLGLEFLFLCTGVLILVIAVIFKPTAVGQTNPADEATCVLLRNAPLTSAIANAALIFATFLCAIPGILRPKDRLFLRIHSWLVIFGGAVSLVVGLVIWISTLQTRSNLGSLWAQQTINEQSALQKQFNCCGYFDENSPPFISDQTCTNALTAKRLGPCIGPFSSFANNVLDIVFTTMFGLVAVDGLLFLSTIVMLKKRDQDERYRLIDEKTLGGF